MEIVEDVLFGELAAARFRQALGYIANDGPILHVAPNEIASILLNLDETVTKG